MILIYNDQNKIIILNVTQNTSEHLSKIDLISTSVAEFEYSGRSNFSRVSIIAVSKLFNAVSLRDFAKSICLRSVILNNINKIKK